MRRYARRVSEPHAGRGIVVASWVGVALFAAAAVPAAAGVSAFDPVALGTALSLFFVGIVVWLWAFLAALVRSANGDDIAVGSLFLVEGAAPRRVRIRLYAALIVSVVVAAGTATSDAFGILVPMLPAGFIGFWGARHGVFPPRRERA
jgi:hypothetical protein